MSYYLFLDSSNTSLAVGVSNEDKVLASTEYECWQSQSEHMIPEIDKMLTSLNVSKDQISRVYVCIGPGSYTGVRIALTIAKVMATSLGCEIYPVNSLHAEKDCSSPSICLINARSGRSYFAVYEGEKELEKCSIKTNDEVKEYIQNHPSYTICGDTKYLGIEGKKSSIVEQMFSLKDSLEKCENPMGLKPLYMKD